MFKKIALGLLVVIVAAALVIVALAANKPDTFVCERTLEMDAPREAVLPLVADFRNLAFVEPVARIRPEPDDHVRRHDLGGRRHVRVAG